MASRVSGGGLTVVCWLLVLELAAVRVTSGALLRFASEFDLQPPSGAGAALDDDDLELNEFRLFDAPRQTPEFDEFDADLPFFRTDYDLSQLSPISPTPAFTLDPSYIRPDHVLLARAKRANRLRKASKLRKRNEALESETDRDADEDDDDDDRNEEEGKDNSGEVSGDVEDYATRYEQFIAKHFDDVEAKRDRLTAAKQRKGAGKGGKGRKSGSSKDDTEDEEDQGDDSEQEKDGNYKFDRFDYSSSDDYERIKAESEEQSKRLSADPRNCRTYEKDGMVCSVCHDPASDSASESCAYATEPHHRKYAFVKERNYDSKKDGPKREQPVAADDDEEDDDEVDERAEDTDGDSVDRPERQTTTGASTSRKPLPRPILRSNPHQLANGGGYRYQPSIVIKDMRSNRAPISMKLREKGEQPEKKGATDSDIYVMDYGERDEVAKVLSDFATRDWSNCRKAKRSKDGEMTCYQCKDAAGVNHEECMYVSESRQIASRLLFPAPPAAAAAASASSPPPPTTIDRKRRKVVGVKGLKKEDARQLPIPATEGHGPAREKQTVKRTVSFRSFVTGSGATGFGASGEPDSPSERVIHYEHHISHEVP